MLQHRIVVGSFHKTGTVLLNRTFRNICKKLKLEYLHGRKVAGPERWTEHQREAMETKGGRVQGFSRDWDIAFAPRADFAKLIKGHPHRGVVVLRDPRDVIISGAHYHMKAREAWLHKPKEEFGGKTYQQAINALPDDEARYVFEMDNAGRRTVKKMLTWATPPEGFTTTRLEVLAADHEFVEFRRIFSFLGFEGEELEACLRIARKVSLFSRETARAEAAAQKAAKTATRAAKATKAGKAESKAPAAPAEKTAKPARRKSKPGKHSARAAVHVRSGGAAGQWRSTFSPAVLAAFVERFGDAPERLGYPPSLLPVTEAVASGPLAA